MEMQPCLEVRELVFTADVDRWCKLAEAMGGCEIISTPDYAEFWMPGGGLLGVHQADERNAPGTCALQIITEDFDASCGALKSLGISGRTAQEDFGRVFGVMAGPEGPDVTLIEGTVSDRVTHPGAVMVTPLSLVRDVEAGRGFFETLGLTPILRSNAGTFVEMTASGGGEVLVHYGDGGASLSFQVDDVSEFATLCRRANLSVSLIDEAYGRTALIEGLEGQIWVNERQRDFYGYERLEVA